MTELPLLVINVQRGGPSTGLPTKTEQSDLLQVMYGRNGDSPVPVLCASTPGDCFEMTYEALRLAVKYMTPVMLLTDGYIANGTEPWKIPDIDDLNDFSFGYGLDPEMFKPFLRNPETLARPWAVPGTPGLEHRLTGIEHEAVTGFVSYDPDNHHQQTMERKAKVAGMARDIPPTKVRCAPKGDLLVISWGGTFGSVATAVEETHKAGHKIGHVHLRHLNPLPSDLKGIADGFKQIIVPEINAGQLGLYLTGMFYRPVLGYNRVRGKQFMVSELVTEFTRILKAGA
jgi:2-oxoglutarate ferredoxin oxidoreductase subunit alpha